MPQAPITLVLLPGLDGTDVFFRPLLALLPAHVQTVAVEFPDGGPYDYASLLARVLERTAALPRYYVLGSSFSGPLAAMLAQAEGERVQGVIFSATFLRSPKRALAPFRALLCGPLIWAVRVLRRLPVWFMRASDDPLRIAKRETWARVSARGLAGRGRAVLGVDARTALAGCKAPVLCLIYDDDKVVPRRYTEEIAQCHPPAQFAVLRGGHFGMFSDPQALAEVLLRFVGPGVTAT